MHLRRPLSAAAATLLAGALAGTALSSPAVAAPRPDPAGHCARQPSVVVPGAQKALVACLPDLTTAYLTTQEAGRYTDVADWTGLHTPGTTNPTGVPGIQVDGYFADTSTKNTNHGWRHDAQFVVRLPDRWNGGLVVTGAPGTREQYANDFPSPTGSSPRATRSRPPTRATTASTSTRRHPAGRRRRRVARPGHPAHPRRAGRGQEPLRRGAAADLHGRHRPTAAT